MPRAGTRKPQWQRARAAYQVYGCLWEPPFVSWNTGSKDVETLNREKKQATQLSYFLLSAGQLAVQYLIKHTEKGDCM